MNLFSANLKGIKASSLVKMLKLILVGIFFFSYSVFSFNQPLLYCPFSDTEVEVLVQIDDVHQFCWESNKEKRVPIIYHRVLFSGIEDYHVADFMIEQKITKFEREKLEEIFVNLSFYNKDLSDDEKIDHWPRSFICYLMSAWIREE